MNRPELTPYEANMNLKFSRSFHAVFQGEWCNASHETAIQLYLFRNCAVLQTLSNFHIQTMLVLKWIEGRHIPVGY